jgi:hypothetical protein
MPSEARRYKEKILLHSLQRDKDPADILNSVP